MKVVIDEVSGEGLESFLGKEIALYCVNYIYAGTLVGVNDTCVKLTDAHIVYETGPFDECGWKDAQALPGDTHYVQLVAVESFGGVK